MIEYFVLNCPVYTVRRSGREREKPVMPGKGRIGHLMVRIPLFRSGHTGSTPVQSIEHALLSLPPVKSRKRAKYFASVTSSMMFILDIE